MITGPALIYLRFWKEKKLKQLKQIKTKNKVGNAKADIFLKYPEKKSNNYLIMSKSYF